MTTGKRLMFVSMALMLATVGTAGAESTGEQVFKRCIRCHGFQGDQSALGWSATIGGWPADKLTGALQGYKKGQYGGEMKGVMEEQAAALGDEDIQALSEYIASLKSHSPKAEEPKENRE